MKRKSTPNFLRQAAALVLAVILTIPTVYAAAGENKLQTATELAKGLTYRNTITVNNSSRIESFSLELEEKSSVQPILVQPQGTVYGAGSINTAVSYAQQQGYHVLGAINTDFFDTSTGVPLGIVVEEGVYKSGAEREAAMAITDGRISLVEVPQVDLSLVNETSGQMVVPHHFNKARSSAGGVYLLNRDFSDLTKTTGAGWFVRMQVVDEEGGFWGNWGFGRDEQEKLTVNSTMTLEVIEMVQTDQSVAIGEDEYLLTASNASGYQEVYQSFQVGDQVTLTTFCQDEDLSGAQWACGVGDVMIRDGSLTDSSRWTYMKDGRAPRTALGVRRDGTAVFYAVDGRKNGYSMGLTQMDLADEMLAQGCEWAVNLDGGGSTAISVWVPGQPGPKLQNAPSDGRPRNCATYLLLVTEDRGNGRVSRLALKEDGLTVLAGSSLVLPEAVALDDGLNLVDRDLGEIKFTSKERLGEIEDGVYYADYWAGTDTLQLSARRVNAKGTAQIHVVDHLTDLTISREGEQAALTAMTVKPGETVQLAVRGSYWNREALRDWAPVTWEVTGDIGTVDENGLFTAAKMGGSGTITATAGGVSQTINVSMTNVHNDVPEGHWAYDAVDYCYARGIVTGVSPTEFGVDGKIRRADFMLMLYNAAGRPAVTGGCDFTDVSSADYYYTALAWGQSQGLISGVGNGTYDPKSPITREQAFTILHRAMPLLGKDCPTASTDVLDQFADKGQISGYAQEHVATLVAQGVLGGKSGKIDPKGELKRVEMAVLLYNIMTYTPIWDQPSQPAEEEMIGTVADAEGGLNIRSGPGTSFDVLGHLVNGDQVAVLEVRDGWCQILYWDQNGRQAVGYVSADYILLS